MRVYLSDKYYLNQYHRNDVFALGGRGGTCAPKNRYLRCLRLIISGTAVVETDEIKNGCRKYEVSIRFECNKYHIL